MPNVDLAVIGGGLAACSLIAHLRKRNYKGTIGLVEAGRGAGGRAASRQSRGAPGWRIDHGAPSFNLTTPPPEGVRFLLNQLEANGFLVPDDQPIVGLDRDGRFTPAPHNRQLEGQHFRGQPSMANLCDGLLAIAGQSVQTHYEKRIRWLQRQDNQWLISTEDQSWTLSAKQLVLSGNLLAHPRVKSLLGWEAIPLRVAVDQGVDPQLDDVLDCIGASRASSRWTCMIQLNDADQPEITANWPRQIWLDHGAQARWPVERLVVQPQQVGGLGLVMHGLPAAEAIPANESTQTTRQQRERMFLDVLPALLACLPEGSSLLDKTRSWGVMRWGAAQPLDHPLPLQLQYCSNSAIGFCGDWVDTPGFGRVEGALRSGVSLAEKLTANG